MKFHFYVSLKKIVKSFATNVCPVFQSFFFENELQKTIFIFSVQNFLLIYYNIWVSIPLIENYLKSIEVWKSRQTK